jgi:hypothetical protein
VSRYAFDRGADGEGGVPHGHSCPFVDALLLAIGSLASVTRRGKTNRAPTAEAMGHPYTRGNDRAGRTIRPAGTGLYYLLTTPD